VIFLNFKFELNCGTVAAVVSRSALQQPISLI